MRRRVVRSVVAVVTVGSVLMLASCASFSPFMFREAPLPEGWPERAPVGQVRVQTYPAYRAASVAAERAGGGMEPMFGVLFEHIKDEGIPMTAPVDMGYSSEDVAAGPTSMAFLYRTRQMGAPASDGDVKVADVEPATFASLGVRGGYSPGFIAAQVSKLRAWLDAQTEWRAVGPPRYLGYNSPFVPGFLRYGEVQIPVQRVPPAAEGEPAAQ